MKYVNANDILPEELLSIIQEYFQGGYLYIPKKNDCAKKQQTDYKLELEKRNWHIYLKHLEGRTNKQLQNIYHLSESSIRRIVSKEKVRYRRMKEIIEQILPLWNIESRQLSQIYPSAWEIIPSPPQGHPVIQAPIGADALCALRYIIKVYDNEKQLKKNIKILEILSKCDIPVAEIVPTPTGETYAAYQNVYFLMTKKLKGSNITDRKDKSVARKMGCAIACLHRAFKQCEKEIAFGDNSLLQEMKGWIRENLSNNDWHIIDKESYTKTVAALENIYDYLPKQLIHRDVHFGNFLFFEGSLSGYIDFDLSQRNIRIFDICYFLAGLLAEETDHAFTKNEWIESVKAVVAGYESIMTLSAEEKSAIPCVMESIEILFIAYFIGIKDTKHANDANSVFRFIQNCESDIKNMI